MELNFINSLQYIKPEIAITAVIFLIVLVDLIWQKNKAALPWLSLAGLIVTSYYVIEQFDMNASAFIANGTMGMITADPFGAFFKLLVILSSVIIIFFSL